MNDYQIKRIINNNEKTKKNTKIFSIILFIVENIFILNFVFGLFGIFMGQNPANYFIFTTLIEFFKTFSFSTYGLISIHFILIMLTYFGSIPIFIMSLIKNNNCMYYIIYPTVILTKTCITYYFYGINPSMPIFDAIIMNFDLIILGIVNIVNIATLYTINSKYKSLYMTIFQILKLVIGIILLIYIYIINISILINVNADGVSIVNVIPYLTIILTISAFSLPILNGNHFISDSYLTSSIILLSFYTTFNIIFILGDMKNSISFVPILMTNIILFSANLVFSIMLKVSKNKLNYNEEIEAEIKENIQKEKIVVIKKQPKIEYKDYNWLNRLFAGLMFISLIIMVIHFFTQPVMILGTFTYNIYQIIIETFKNIQSTNLFETGILLFLIFNLFNVIIIAIIMFFVSMAKGKNYMSVPAIAIYVITRPLLYYYWSFSDAMQFFVLNWDLLIFLSLLIPYIIIDSILNIKIIGVHLLIFRIVKIIIAPILISLIGFIIPLDNSIPKNPQLIFYFTAFLVSLIMFSLPLMGGHRLNSKSGLASSIIILSILGTFVIIYIIAATVNPHFIYNLLIGHIILLSLFITNLIISILLLSFTNVRINKYIIKLENESYVKPLNGINNDEFNNMDNINENIDNNINEEIENEIESTDSSLIYNSIIETEINNENLNDAEVVDDLSNEISNINLENELDNSVIEDNNLNNDEINQKDIDTNDNIINQITENDTENINDDDISDDDINNYGRY